MIILEMRKNKLKEKLEEIERYALTKKDDFLIEKIKEAKEEEKKLHKLIYIDELTNVFNRRGLKEILAEKIAETKRSKKKKLSIIISDLDNFKYYNDKYGHEAGDNLLKTYSKIIKNNIREYDIVARYGGDEFVIVLPETSFPEAKIVAERIRKKLIEESEKKGKRISASFGITEYPNITKNPENIIRDADKALYEAKNIKNKPG
jgi:two-component system cell cycle response regulator